MNYSLLDEFDNHEAITELIDEQTGLRGYIAVHRSIGGIAVGGTRYFPYGSARQALQDALRLSRAMSYKCALAGVSYGGGKAVLIGDSHSPKSEQLLAAYADRINAISPALYTGEDVGMSDQDVAYLANHSSRIIGRKAGAGDPSPWAALGVFHAMRAALEAIFSTSKMQGRTFAVKGLGKVGLSLCTLLSQAGGRVIAADIDPARIDAARALIPNITIVPSLRIHELEVDVYSPCAMGEEFTYQTIPQLRCKIICGAANNQLQTFENGVRLHQRGILYVPDYVANAGGLINVAADIVPGNYKRESIQREVEDIYRTVQKIIMQAKEQSLSISETADRMAQAIIASRSIAYPASVPNALAL